jgi:hypothetical protein
VLIHICGVFICAVRRCKHCGDQGLLVAAGTTD